MMNFRKKTKLMALASFLAAILVSVGGFAINASAKTPLVRQDASSYIGLDAAQNAALAHAGVQDGDTHYCNRWLEYQNKCPAYYKVEFVAGNVSYEYEIDLYSGEILNCNTAQLRYYYPPASAGNAGSAGSDGNDAASGSVADIGATAAKQAALNHAGISEAQTSKLEIKQDRHDGRLEYKVEFKYGKEKYKYVIDASTGNILKIG